jgi:hypothetical protein
VPGKLAIKRLTGSDLTFFEHQYRTEPKGKQKAINLNSEILVDRIYPALRRPEAATARFPVDLYLYGPGISDACNLQRKVLKQEKNWRLNGELVYDADDALNRFNALKPGDLAIMEFSDGVEPEKLRIVFLSREMTADERLHSELSAYLGDESMIEVSEPTLARLIASAGAPDSHPLRTLVDDAETEDLALGGAEVRERLIRRRLRRRISPEDFRRAKETADRVGLMGEQFVNDYFVRLCSQGLIQDFEWVSAVDVVSPFDFRVIESDGTRHLVDVKSTEGGFERNLHLSYSELRQAVDGNDVYSIYRVYDMDEEHAQLRIAAISGHQLPRDILHALDRLPPGTKAESVTVEPVRFPFTGPIDVRAWE